MSVATRFRSRRFPPLRVVSPTHTHVRHATIVDYEGGADRVFEVFTFEEIDDLAGTELVGTHKRYLLPGLGYLIIREPNGWNERADIIDLQRQAMEAIEAEDE
jgi:hypothetical protein